MRILSVIPARGGSKRLPGKNVRILGGKPLIQWSIESAFDASPDVCDVLVTTDHVKIAEIAGAAGALVPWLRPAELATDTAGSVDVCLHALDWYEREHGQVDGLLLLQPTTPYRRRSTLLRGIQLYRDEGRSVVGVAPASVHPMWCMRVDGLQMRPYVNGDGLSRRSQDLPLAYAVCGAFYLISPKDLRQHASFCPPNAVPLLIDAPLESIDIDTEVDWKLAQVFLHEFLSECHE
jgi:CMP-N,N'-diacetyllegionaminic acid synthase